MTNTKGRQIHVARYHFIIFVLSGPYHGSLRRTVVPFGKEHRNDLHYGVLCGSLRLWDLLGEAAFGNLLNMHVLKIRAAAAKEQPKTQLHNRTFEEEHEKFKKNRRLWAVKF